MRGTVEFGLLVGMILAASRPLGGPPVPRPTTGPIAPTPPPGSPLLRSVPLFSPDVLAVDEQTSRVFVGGGEGVGVGHVSTLDARSGAVLHAAVIGTLPRAIVVDALTNRVFVASFTSETVSVLDARTGAVLRTVKVVGQPTALAVDVRTNRVFLANEAGAPDGAPGNVSVLDGRSGAVLRKVGVGTNPTAVAVDAATRRVFVAIPAIGAMPGKKVLVLDARDGSLLRSVPVGPIGVDPHALTVDTRTNHVFACAGVGVTMLDARDGAVLRSVQTPASCIALIAATRIGRVFATLTPGDQDGYVSTVDARSGAMLRTVNTGGTIAAPAVDERTGRVYVLIASPSDVRSGALAGPGRLVVLNAQTGAVRRTVTLPDEVGDGGGHTYGVAVDTRTLRVFVISDHFVNVYDATRL